MNYRETALLACSVMFIICLLGTLQLLQNDRRINYSILRLRRLYRNNGQYGKILLPLSALGIAVILWRGLIVLSPTDDIVRISCEVLIFWTIISVGIIACRMKQESERFRRAGEKLEQFIQEMKTSASMSAEEVDNKILEARLTALELKELMGRAPTDDTWLGENGESQFK